MTGAPVEAELPEDWLATLIRGILHTWIDGAEPPPDIWTQIRRVLRPRLHLLLYLPITWRKHIMFLSELDFLVRREQYKDLLREAERARLVGQAQAGQEKRNHFYCRTLAWLGRRLVGWGWHLQERYGAATAAPALRAVNRIR